MAEATKKARAEHAWVGKSGKRLTGDDDRIENARGIYYKDVETGEEAVVKLADLSTEALTMLAAFGARTLATNTASQARQARANQNGTESDVAAIVARFAEIQPDRWAAPSEGTGGPRFDAEVLAAAIAEFKGDGDSATYLARLNSDESFKVGDVDYKDGRQYGNFALRNANVNAIYSRLKGRPVATAENL